MNKRTLLRISALLFLGAFSNARATQPNVVVIVADDLGYADMAFLPHAPRDVKAFGTPGFDRLAETGVYFKNAYVTAPICSSSRAGLLTGQCQYRWGDYFLGTRATLPPNTPVLPEVLHQAGYATAKYGKTHLNGWGDRYLPTCHGFDEFLGFMSSTCDYIRLSQKDADAYKSRNKGAMGVQKVGPLLKSVGYGAGLDEVEYVSYENDFSTRIFTDEACKYIQRKKDGKPFYLHVSYNAVHHPTYITEKTWAAKVGARYVPWDRTAKKWGFPYWEPNEESNKKFHAKWGHMDEIDVEGRRCYLANLLALDDGVLQILNTLEEAGLRENTIVVFVSDNGGTMNTFSCNAPLTGFKYMYGDGGIRIPMMVSMPGTIPQGVINDTALVSTMDIFPTLTELAGIATPAQLEGKSLLPVLNDPTKTHHDWLAWTGKRGEWAIRKGKWKLTHKAGWTHRSYTLAENGDVLPGGKPYTYPDVPQLFNLEEDVGETTNQIDQYPEVVKELTALYTEWNAPMPKPQWGKK